MAKPRRKPNETRKPPDPSESHAEVEEWIRRKVMPDLNPVVRRVDDLIRGSIPNLRYAIKWGKVYYGLEDRGWIVEMVAYDVSVNVVFLGGADFDEPPPLGNTDRSRYVKITTPEEAEGPDMRAWIQEAATVPGWE